MTSLDLGQVMKYELKNKLLQEQLNSLSDGDFIKRLNEQTLDGCSPDLAFSVKFGKPVGNYCHRFSIAFQVDEILIHKEYDASRWNSYPQVIPPEGVPLRLEIWRQRNGHREVARLFASYKGSSFYEAEGRQIFIGKGDDVQFKSWE